MLLLYWDHRSIKKYCLCVASMGYLEQFPCAGLLVTLLDLIRWWYLWLLRCICLPMSDATQKFSVDKAILAQCVLPITVGQWQRSGSGTENSITMRWCPVWLT